MYMYMYITCTCTKLDRFREGGREREGEREGGVHFLGYVKCNVCGSTSRSTHSH